ncbi:peptidoglycan-binding protein, partial [Klebsiella pneumoniae]|uniref:peptidoglycan-binding domain-containing protein n=1 Tax=Klebsiella pneumoniae TaxID=573 RepID=UPI00376EC65D
MAGYPHVTIGGAVGRGGVNRSTDVRAIQQLLNIRRSAWSSRPLRVDGMCGTQTLRAIAEAQYRLVGRPRSDGRIDPNGPTLRLLNAMRSVPRAAPRATSTPSPEIG